MKLYCVSKVSCVLLMFVVLSGAVALSGSPVHAADTQSAEKRMLFEQELTSEKILTHLPLLVRTMRERQVNADGLYPQLPKALDINTDTSTVSNTAIAELMAIAVRDLRDNKRREQALSVLNPLLLDAIGGKVQNIPPDQALEILSMTEFYRDNSGWLPVVRKDSEQASLIVGILAEVLQSKDIAMSKIARGLLWSYAHFLVEKRDYICKVLDAFDDSLRMKEYFERPFTTITPIMSFEEYDEIRKMSKEGLAVLHLEKPLNTVVTSTLEQRLKDGDPESDTVRVMLLAKQHWKPKSGHGWAVPPAVAEADATPAQQRTRDVILEQLEAEVDATADGDRFSWATDILSWLARPPKGMNIYSEGVQYRPYGSDTIIRILNKILYKVGTGEGIAVLDILDKMMALDESIRKPVCAMIRDHADRLVNTHPEWNNEAWFISNTEPPPESGGRTAAPIYYKTVCILRKYS